MAAPAMKRHVLAVALLAAAAAALCAPAAAAAAAVSRSPAADDAGGTARAERSFAVEDDAFWLDGRRTQLLSGSLHYSRVPHEARRRAVLPRARRCERRRPPPPLSPSRSARARLAATAPIQGGASLTLSAAAAAALVVLRHNTKTNQYWRDRLLRLRAMGLNAVQTYVPWNFHEAAVGDFDFTGDRDLPRARRWRRRRRRVSLAPLPPSPLLSHSLHLSFSKPHTTNPPKHTVPGAGGRAGAAGAAAPGALHLRGVGRRRPAALAAGRARGLARRARPPLLRAAIPAARRPLVGRAVQPAAALRLPARRPDRGGTDRKRVRRSSCHAATARGGGGARRSALSSRRLSLRRSSPPH